MQLCCKECPHIADNPPLPQACKEVLHPCAMEPMDIAILLLGFTQSFPPNRRYSSEQAALIGTIMCTYFKIKELPMWAQRTVLIPNHYIRRGSRHKVTYPYYIPKIVHSHGNLINMACVFGIEKDIRHIPTTGHAISKVGHEIGPLGPVHIPNWNGASWEERKECLNTGPIGRGPCGRHLAEWWAEWLHIPS